MTKVTIDNKEYEFENLSERAKGQLNSIRFIDQELVRLQAQAAIYQTARASYSKELNAELNPLGSGDTIQF